LVDSRTGHKRQHSPDVEDPKHKNRCSGKTFLFLQTRPACRNVILQTLFHKCGLLCKNSKRPKSPEYCIKGGEKLVHGGTVEVPATSSMGTDVLEVEAWKNEAGKDSTFFSGMLFASTSRYP
jgi:hypothetical protein